MSSHKPALLGIVGGGNMGRAIISGATSARLLAPGEIVVCETDPRKRDELSRWGVQVCGQVGEMLARLMDAPRPLSSVMDGAYLGACGGQVLLAVKPQMFGEVAEKLRSCDGGLAAMPRVVISIMAGVSAARIHAALGGASPVVRVMPNTPARLRKGVTAMAAPYGGADAGASPAHGEFAYALFMGVGEVVRIDESLMDAFTALAGSGPAYVFYLAEAMVRAAQEVGFDRITADRVVRRTIEGAASLLAESNEPPEGLRAAVTSKGGTTEAAIAELDHSAVMDAVVRAVAAGRDRGRELGAR